MGTPPDGPPSSGPNTLAVQPESPPREAHDVVVVQAQTEHGAIVVRLKSEENAAPSIEVGELRPLREGQPIMGEVLKLTPREDPRVFDAEVLANASASDPSVPSGRQRAALPHKGPARVSTEAFRANWDGIFGAQSTRGAVN